MKIILWAETTVNGFYPHASSEGFKTPDEIWADFFEHIAEAGNVIFGRKTVDEVLAAGKGMGVGEAAVVAVSRKPSELPGVISVNSPQAAVEALEAKGFDVAFVGGGETILNAFLAEGLADELVFVVPPVLGGSEFNVALPEGQFRDLRLLSVKELGSGILKLHYSMDRG